MKRKKVLFVLYICMNLTFISGFAQTEKIDSLVEVFRSTQNDSIKLHNLYHIANIYHSQADYPNALKYFFIILKIGEARGDLKHIAVSYGNIGEMYRLQNKYPIALQYYFKSLAIAEKTGDKKSVANCYNNMGLVYQSQGNYNAALKNHFACLKIKQEINDTAGVAAAFNNIGIVYDYQKDYPKALINYQASLKVSESVRNLRGVAVACMNIGQLKVLLKNFSEAEDYLNKGLKLSKEFGFKDYVMTAYASLSELYGKQGNWEKAYKYHELYSDIRDEIVSIENNRQVVEMQTKYETEKKEKENLLLVRENKIKTLELSKKGQQRNILIGSFILVILTGYFFFNQYRLKSKNKLLQEREMRTNAILQAQEEEKARISKELHDGVGPLLSLIKLNLSSIESGPANEKIITKTKELASESIKEVRNISHSLMPSLLTKSGLKPALSELIEQVNVGGLKLELDYQISTTILPEAEVNIYRIIQETVNNILKHSGASLAKIQFEQNGQNMLLIISDNGKGFDIDTSSPGNGLNNIYSRVDIMKGKINISSNPATGSCFTIHLPLKQIIHV